ncbi:MAG: helix-hairpin-helix domain-containing protein [Bacteroidetes bacterium]|nr:helix-hairpin-helix domain-containing protein [Bacteroidota bacterium]
MGFKEHLDFSKGEQLAVVVLILILLVFIGVYFIPLNSVNKRAFSSVEIDSILSRHQHAKAQQQEKQKQKFDAVNPDASAAAEKLTPFKFNPNKLPEAQWKKMGLADYQIRNIKNYELKGGKFFRKEDLKKIYTITDLEYSILEPYIEIPDLSRSTIAKSTISNEKKLTKPAKEEKPKQISSIEINSADSLLLLQLPQIGAWYAHRIMQYRAILGGYVNKNQLLEVYGMDRERYTQFEKFIEVDTSQTQRLRLNYADFKEVVRHPYISYALTKAIFNHRERKGMINDWKTIEQLLPADDSLSVYLSHYLQYN